MDMESRTIRDRFYGLDFLRGMGVALVIALHSALYYYSGLFGIDFDSPPAIITVIGFLLMFAGMFAMISGAAHTVQAVRKLEYGGFTIGKLMRYYFASGIFILAVAYTYFLFTGPGIISMESGTIDKSILVQLIQDNHASGLSMERVLYVDSLVMIGMNLVFLGMIEGAVFWRCRGPNGLDVARSGRAFLVLGVFFLVISLLRIPLYSVYIDAVGKGDWALILPLNLLVNKNNPIMPFLSFGLFGAWIGCLLSAGDFGRTLRRVIPAGIVMLVAGIAMYVNLPDTMLRRTIDLKWYSIMVIQSGLFMLLIISVLRIFDYGRAGSRIRTGFAASFIMRFGVAGLTPFFLEAVASAMVFRLMNVFGRVEFDIPQALAYGFSLALIWGALLMAWEKRSYRYSIEDWYCTFLRRFGGSAKEVKMKRGPL